MPDSVTPEHSKIMLNIESRKITFILGAITALLVLLSILGQSVTFLFKDFAGYGHVRGIIRFFNVDEENNLPTIFSFFLLLSSFLLLLLITQIEKKLKDPGIFKWSMLTICIFFMMFDEVFSFHEKLIIPVRQILDSGTYGIFYFAWVIPGTAFLIIFVVFFYSLFKRLELKVRRIVLLAGILYFGGAIGFELIGGWYEEIHGENFAYNMIATVEESLEMSGMIVFIKGLLSYISSGFKTLEFELRSPED